MKALVVDDDIVSRMALMDLLAALDMFDLVEAQDGRQAWAMMEAGLRPVICFCDVRMPHMSGIDLLQRMKQSPLLATVPFVLVSSASDRDTVLQAVSLGAIGYILKPLHAPASREHLDKIFAVTLDKLVEPPAATLRRLHIKSERLNAYLNAFSGQLASARADIATLLHDDGQQARARIDAVHTGCMTLGLWHVAERLDAVRAVVLDQAGVGDALLEAAATVERQGRRVRAAGLSGASA